MERVFPYAFNTTERMKIALVTETYPPEVNGVAMTLEHLVSGLRRRGHEVEVVRPRQGRGDDGAKDGGEHICTGLPLPGYKGLHFGVKWPGSLLRHWVADKPDLVHVATEGPLGWAAIRASRRLGVPTVSSYHTNFHSYGRHYGFGMFVRTALAWLRHVHNSTLLTFAPSPDVVRTLVAEGFHNVRLMGRGVDADLFAPTRRDDALRAAWGAGPDTPVAVYVGRLAGEKNIPCAIAAFGRLKARFSDLKVILVGDGPQMPALRAAHPDFVFAGMRKGADLAAHYASADIFVFASMTETFGNVVTEAMASGLPVLAYNYAAPARYVRDGESGMLAPFGDESAFLAKADAMADACPRWKSMGQSARQTALGISWDAVLDSYLRDVGEAVKM
jgi:glycosyltransferase involved in cell wall biosynthesis